MNVVRVTCRFQATFRGSRRATRGWHVFGVVSMGQLHDRPDEETHRLTHSSNRAATPMYAAMNLHVRSKTVPCQRFQSHRDEGVNCVTAGPSSATRETERITCRSMASRSTSSSFSPHTRRRPGGVQSKSSGSGAFLVAARGCVFLLGIPSTMRTALACGARCCTQL